MGSERLCHCGTCAYCLQRNRQNEKRRREYISVKGILPEQEIIQRGISVIQDSIAIKNKRHVGAKGLQLKSRRVSFERWSTMRHRLLVP